MLCGDELHFVRCTAKRDAVTAGHVAVTCRNTVNFVSGTPICSKKTLLLPQLLQIKKRVLSSDIRDVFFNKRKADMPSP
jgi:hypothetical protein